MQVGGDHPAEPAADTKHPAVEVGQPRHDPSQVLTQIPLCHVDILHHGLCDAIARGDGPVFNAPDRVARQWPLKSDLNFGAQGFLKIGIILKAKPADEP